MVNFNVFFILAYNLALIAGSTYMVQVYGWSLWTIFFAVLFTASIRKNDA